MGVVIEKVSWGIYFLICDVGFNNYFVVCGMMGLVIRCNWCYINISVDDVLSCIYMLVGLLCMMIDVFVFDIVLFEMVFGDVLVVVNLGVYGLMVSLICFISYFEFVEVLFDGEDMIEVFESVFNYWEDFVVMMLRVLVVLMLDG